MGRTRFKPKPLDRHTVAQRMVGPAPAPREMPARAKQGWEIILEDLRQQVKDGVISKTEARERVPWRWMRQYFVGR